MVFARFGFDKGEVDARVDLEVVKLIVEGASEDDKKTFRSFFLNWFPNHGEKYNLNEDTSVELKAMMLVVSFALFNVTDVDCKESVELTPFMKEVMKSEFFRSALQAMAAIVFGISQTAVRIMKYLLSFNLSVSLIHIGFFLQQIIDKTMTCQKSVKNKLSFKNTVLKHMTYTGHRCFQYLCITILYQIMADSFFKNYITLDAKVAKTCDLLEKHKKDTSVWKKVMIYYRDEVFKEKGKVQQDFGYAVYVNFLISHCIGASNENLKSGKPKSLKRKLDATSRSGISSPTDKTVFALALQIGQLNATVSFVIS